MYGVKKFFSLVLAVVLLVSFAACGGPSEAKLDVPSMLGNAFESDLTITRADGVQMQGHIVKNAMADYSITIALAENMQMQYFLNNETVQMGVNDVIKTIPFSHLPDTSPAKLLARSLDTLSLPDELRIKEEKEEVMAETKKSDCEFILLADGQTGAFLTLNLSSAELRCDFSQFTYLEMPFTQNQSSPQTLQEGEVA